MSFPLRSAFGVLVALCALQGGTLQAQSIHEFGGQQVSVPWAPDDGPFGRSRSGHLTGDGIADVAVLVGHTLFVLVDADARDARIELPLHVEDFDVLPGGAPGGAAALVSVGANALVLTWFDESAQGFVHATLDAAAWADARLVRAVDVDGDGLHDLVGVDGDGRALLVLRAQGPAQAFSALPSGMASAPVRDLCGVQWDNDPGLELALLTDLGVEVFEAGGALRDAWLGILPGGAIARLRQGGLAKDRIAWVTAYAPPAVQMLLTLAPGGAIHDSLDLGALDVFAAVGGDYDLDGDDDLLVSHHHSNELIWFENKRTFSQPLVPSFETPNPVLTLLPVGPPGAAVLNQATPVSADLDGDGDLDVLYASQTSGTLELLRGEAIDEAAQRAVLVQAAWDPASSRLTCVLQPPSAGIGSATHLQAVAWRRASLAQPFESAPAFDVLLDLSAGWHDTLAVDLPEATAEFERVYSLELRLVRINAAGKLVESRPASIDYLTGNDANATQLLSQPGCLGTLGVGTAGTEASEYSKVKLIKLPRTGTFAGGYVPYI